MENSFKDESTSEQRLEESRNIIAKCPDQVPVTVERYGRAVLPEMEKKATADPVNVPDARAAFGPRNTEASGQRRSWKLDGRTFANTGINEREPDGSLKRDFTPEQLPTAPDLNQPIPTEYFDPGYLQLWADLNAINGSPAYDAEAIALGSISVDDYFLHPSNYPEQICPIKDICAGLGPFPLKEPILAAIYALAKAQFSNRSISEENVMKIAVLRFQAYQAGWYDRQKHAMRKKPPANFMRIFLQDYSRFEQWMKDAWDLCAFLPFLAEFSFRVFGYAYTKGRAAEYVGRAEKVANSSGLSHLVKYLPADLLFGIALPWIGVYRPMQYLRQFIDSKFIPDAIKVRADSAPAGQALVCTTNAVIKSMISANWWDEISRAGNYDASTLVLCAAKIHADPWKYHMMSQVYKADALTDAEKNEVNKARSLAVDFSPIVQAYLDTILKNSDLSKSKVLRKHAQANPVLYQRARKFFTAAKQKMDKVSDEPTTKRIRIADIPEASA